MSSLAYQLARRAHELLGDGEWHDYEPVVRELSKLVPPGRAMRDSERMRLRKRGGPGERVQPREVADQIASGARQIVTDHLRNSRVYEASAPGVSGPRQPRRQIRLIGTHRLLGGDPYRQLRDQLEHTVDVLREQIDVVRKYLIDTGQADVADELLPPLDD